MQKGRDKTLFLIGSKQHKLFHAKIINVITIFMKNVHTHLQLKIQYNWREPLNTCLRGHILHWLLFIKLPVLKPPSVVSSSPVHFVGCFCQRADFLLVPETVPSKGFALCNFPVVQDLKVDLRQNEEKKRVGCVNKKLWVLLNALDLLMWWFSVAARLTYLGFFAAAITEIWTQEPGRRLARRLIKGKGKKVRKCKVLPVKDEGHHVQV